MKGTTSTGLEDAFVKVSFEDDKTTNVAREGDSEVFSEWVDKASATYSNAKLIGADVLRKLYPKHSLVMSQDYNFNVFGFPGAVTMPLKPNELITNTMFIPLARSMGASGILTNSIEFGAFTTAWDKYEFTIYIVKYFEAYDRVQHFILHDGPEDPIRELILAIGTWAWELHDEIWVFNQGYWQKNHGLWVEIQKANWDDVILKESFKESLQQDVYGFFDSERLYKDLGIAWKRGLIMHGPPGNGKTISLKAIMKTVQETGHLPLYVRSFQSWMGEEAAMQEVFTKARQLAPCVIVLEDIDSLINDGNRSFFLNQLDGIEDNDGLLILATTNHFDRLDPGLSSRPSRFDRKYLFDDPDRDERLQYTKYWQTKLINNEKVHFPDSLATEIADLTYGFSFAYLKESFVSSLVLMVSKKSSATFEQVIKSQIKSLRKQLDQGPTTVGYSNSSRRVGHGAANCHAPLPPKPDVWEAARSAFSSVVGSAARGISERTYVL